MAEQDDRDALSEVLRCPGCGSVIDPNRSTCYPLKVDVTQPGYRYLEGIWGYCRTLSRNVRLGEDWLAQRDRRVRAEALRETADEASWPNLGSEPGSGHTSTYSVRRWLRERADWIEAGDQ
ncbi:hypothetical protein [Nocardioides sp. BYT-33-1]|uniref:hypothetical protein n=1 Tax=Nocardioides sp. BYT-33-1 TaxID=3416952 RepID=UPI003F53C390